MSDCYTCPICGKTSERFGHQGGYPTKHHSEVGFFEMSGACSGMSYHTHFPCSFQCAAELSLRWKDTPEAVWAEQGVQCSQEWKCHGCAGPLQGDARLAKAWSEDFPRQAFTLSQPAKTDEEDLLLEFLRFCSLDCLRKFCLSKSPHQ